MKKLLQLVMAVLFPVCLLAQQKTISGKVADQNGTPLSGVSVSVNDNSGRAGALTDAQGQFSITVPQATTELVFSMVGMRSITEKIGNRTTINLTMASGETELTNVVVIGYGTRRKETLTGAISNITNKDIQTTTNISLAQKLQGKVAGLQIRQLGGEPGTFDNNIRIRGYGNNPLYVIDGVVRDGSNEFQRLNPDDIESISFLKDASAAIFGFGSADGVIIVTTKKGSKGKASFTYNGVVGWSSPTNVPRMANAAEWMQLRNDADIFGRGAPFISRDELNKWIAGGPGYESTDWYDVTMKKSSVQQQHNLSASGGSEKTQYYFGLAYVDEQSLLKTNDMGYKRYNFRANITTDLLKNLKAEVLVGARYDNRYTPGENFFNIFKGTRVTLPTEKPYVNNNPDYLAVVTPSNQNPLALTDKDITGYTENITRNVQATASLTYTVPFVRGLSVKGLAAYDLNSFSAKDVSRPYTLYTFANNEFVPQPQRSGQGGISNGFGNGNRVNLQLQANYAVTILNNHNVTATAVFEQRQDWGRDANLRRLYDFYTIDQIDFASDNGMTNGGREWQSASQSVLGRVNYDFNNKYLFEFAFRYMGTYSFPPESRWGFFPVLSAGWRVTEEKFMQQSLPVVSNLKLRASYGEVADPGGIAPFQWIPGFGLAGGGRYEFENGALTNGATSPGIVNGRLTWVKARTSDIGLDLGLWNNKLTFEFDVFRRDREGLPAFRSVSLPNTFGTSLPQENLNSDRTQGFEFTIGHNSTAGAVSYGVSANFGYSRTRNLYVESAPFTNSWERWRNGQSDRYNDIIWGYTYAGQFLTEEEIAQYALQNGDQGNLRELPGDYKYADVNNDGVIDGRDELPLFLGQNGSNDNQNPPGKAPKINYGLNLNASWKRLDVNILLQGAAMYTVRFNEVYAEVLAFRGNTPAYFFDRWHKADPYDSKSAWIPGKYPATRFVGDAGSMYKESSVWRKDASYLRLKSVELGYSFNPAWYKGSGIQRIRLYANGFNLLTFADEFVKPFDPERLEGLFNAGFNYPLSKIFNVGINVTF